MTWILFPSAVMPPSGATGPFVWIEHPLFFGSRRRVPRFHRHKLILHRASMRAAASSVTSHHYIEASNATQWCTHSAIATATEVHAYDPVDHDLESELRRTLGTRLKLHPSPLFLTTHDDLESYPGTLSHASFYRWQLERLSVPGISRSYDKENRRRLPADAVLPPAPPTSATDEHPWIDEAVAYVRGLPSLGDPNTMFTYPVTSAQARRWLNHFIHHRLTAFGPYQDALAPGTVYHSVLSSSLNTGLLTPREVLDAVIAARKDVPVASYEAFVRQLIGWREYERWLYVRYGREMRTANGWNATNRLPRRAWYPTPKGNISPDLPAPVADVVLQAHRTAYMHHIQRLMVILNYMTLSSIRPRDIYSWFMAYSIDSYDWVMVPNVYTMGYAWPGAMRKPYVSSSAYLVRMGQPAGNWSAAWDEAFHAFLLRHRAVFMKTIYAGILKKAIAK